MFVNKTLHFTKLTAYYYNLRCLPFAKKLKLNMGEDYTVYAKQNEPVRSHDFWLKLLIQYYL